MLSTLPMAQLIVRNIDEQVVRELKKRAAAMGRSAEAEHRALLEEALLGPPKGGFKDFLRSMPKVELTRSKSRPRRVRL